MRVSYKWLQEYIDFSYSPEELDYVLTMAGMEVDEIEYMGAGIEEIVIGEILKIRSHPNADKLVICELDTGDELLNIVTGAPNVEEGAMVPVARVGVTLPNGMEIKEAELRGEPSYGMLCSTDELGLSEERASGIMILDERAEKGMKLVEYLDMDDYVLKLDLTPNYARCLGMLGIAREMEALQGDKEVKYPEININEKGQDIEEMIEVEIKDPDLCPRYTGRIIKDVKIGPSPLWMQKRLTAAGIRPINNIVDITNYVLMEYNQPLHAFDYDKVADQKIIVRRAEDGEKHVTLDDQERKLDNEILLIADPDKAIGLAGVMGGANSEVTDETTTVFLESAYFNPVNIRKTSRKLGLPSEASHRFERGLDIENVIEAANRAAYLMQEYAEGTVLPGVIDVYPEPYQALEIELDVEMTNRVLGIELSADEISDMLKKLKFSVEKRGGSNTEAAAGETAEDNVLKIQVPAFRGDVEREADLIEEVARMYGYNNIPVTVPEGEQQGGKSFKQQFEDITKEYMLAAGLDEIVNFSLGGKGDYDILQLSNDSNLRNWVEIKNPLNEAYAVMRTSMMPGVLDVLSKNAKRQLDKMHVFELGNIYFKQEGDEPYYQSSRLAGASMGYDEDAWNSSAPDFFYLKGILEAYFERIGLFNIRFEAAELSYLHPGRTAKVMLEGQELGIIGELLPDIIEELDLKERTAVFQLSIEKLLDRVNLIQRYKDLPRYPAAERDLAVLVDKDIESAALLDIIIEKGSELLKDVDVFDLYQGDQIPENKKSIAFKLLFQAGDRTLRDEEVNKMFNEIVMGLENQYSAKIRGI
ncbi:MAG: phenylalanine--tRNA ligase subunit beta [Halanaerobiales bacterium]